MSKQRVKVPISFKLVMIFSILVIVVLGVTTYMVSTLVRNDEQQKAEENNLTINSRTAETIQTLILNEQADSTGYLNSLQMIKSDSFFDSKRDAVFNDYCVRNSDTIFIYSDQFGLQFNKDFEKLHEQAKEKAENWLKENAEAKEQALSGVVKILNLSQVFNKPSLCILYPYTSTDGNTLAAISFETTKFSDIMSTGANNTTFLINKNGDILIHSDFELVLKNENLSNLKAVKEIFQNPSDNSQNLYPDDKGENWFYAHHKIVGDMYVITAISEKNVFEVINKTTYRIILLSLAVLFIAIFIIRLFSQSLTSPIGDLVEASKQIESGNFNLELESRTKDEIGLLTQSFNEMARGLTERENLKSSFSKFTNSAIAEKAARGELKLGGETRNATIFFSDIRSFTAMSEKLSPQEVVEFLNQYMTRMVECVNTTHGVVDKFIGDAIMAVWGAPETSGSIEEDAWNCVKAALLMRISLDNYNKERISQGKIPMRIGCGINTGSVVAGQIGSNDRMEYTVIGDAVNFASRTESLNKPFATDILITENTWNLVKNKVVVEEMPSVHVKGKEGNVRMFAVINAVGAKGPSDINQLRKFLGVETPDLTKVNTDEEEKKYQINK